ncbi:FHA domain-containing protein [Gemmatimonadota bacterium]
MNQGVPALRICLQPGSEEITDLDFTFSRAFRIGRDPTCEVRLSSPLVSRFHAEVWPEEGAWWIRDLGSTNGVLLQNQPVQRAILEDGGLVQLGVGAPAFQVFLIVGKGRFRQRPDGAETGGKGWRAGSTVKVQEAAPAGAPPPGRSPGQIEPDQDLSLAEVEERYLNPDSDRPAGQRTQFIRIAYARIRKRERRRAGLIIGIIGVLLVASAAYGIVQTRRVAAYKRQAAERFQRMKSLEVDLVRLRQQIEESGSSALLGQLEALDSRRRAARADYEGLVRERGLFRKIKSREEELILQTARIFGESEVAISGAFIEAVQEEIQSYWLSPGGRTRFQRDVERAARRGYTETIVATMKRRGIPPEFFYLALQESDFETGAVGPSTRWGHAKGMWQFIPATAERYGLDPGPRRDTRERDPQDQRQDFELSTDAAARYLRDLHGVLTQASGLLVMAAYNWGEGRIAPRLETLPTPTDVFEADFAHVPEDPASRNYWTFLDEYESRMPEETKTYVIRIFAAAVIGQDPRHFGFDFENPLAAYVD